ncbi:MAG: hypothetical protein Q4D96_08295 [Propionibacteriaceae bacterium]|nr:hypothetical protein [Propionibacteriaceae bacterium]
MSAVSYEPVIVRPRPRVVEPQVSMAFREPSTRGGLRPGRRTLAMRRGVVAGGCAGPTVRAAARPVRAAARPVRDWVAEVQAVVFVVLVLVGLVVAVPKLVAMAQPDPAVDPVPGDPAWSHVVKE